MTRARTITCGALAVLAGAGGQAAASHESKPPDALERPAKIRLIFPDLYRAATAPAQKGVSWNRLRMAARTRWMRTHRCADATVGRRYRLGASSWSIVEATWACDRVPGWLRSTLRCIADREGGRTFPDVFYGGSRGWQGGRFAGTNRVVGHLQDRPYHARRAHPELAGRDLVVTRETFDVITWPVHQARINVAIYLERPGAFATVGACS